MMLTPEQLQEFTGIKAETPEAFKEAFSKKYYTKDQIFKDPDTKKEFFGAAFGSATTGVKQVFDELGVEITGDDLKQPIEAVVKTGLTRMNQKFADERTELEKKAGLTADEKIKEFQEVINKKDQKLKDYEGLLKAKAAEFETLQNNKNQELKQFKLKSIHKDVESAIPWNPDKDEFSKRGWLQVMAEKYVIDIDENDEKFIADRATGTRIKADGTHSTFMTPEEVYKTQAIKDGMAAVNKKAGSPPPSGPGAKKPGEQKQPTNPPQSRRPMANTGWRPD